MRYAFPPYANPDRELHQWCGERGRAYRMALVPHFALFSVLSAARSGQMRGARAQE